MPFILQPRRFNPWKTIWVLAVLVAFFIYTTRRDKAPETWRESGEIFGSTYAVQLVSKDLTKSAWQELMGDVDALLNSINEEFSTWSTNSALSRFNANQSVEPITVPPRIAELASLSLELSRASDGAFDVTFSPLFDAWGFGRTGPKHIPSDEAVAAARARSGYQLLTVLSSNQLQKAVPGVELVFNAIAPGYAAQQIAELLLARGYRNFYVDVGGEIVVRGHNATGGPWRIAVDKPVYGALPGEATEAIFALTNGSLATSGDYRNYVLAEDGTAYSHIFDPRIARPTTSRVASVTVIANNGTWADALATTLSVLGPEAGIPWLSKHTDAQALFIMRDGSNSFHEIATPNFDQYRLAPTAP